MAYTGTLSDDLTGANLTYAEELLATAFEGMTDLIASVIKVLVEFFMQPSVIGTIAALVVILAIAAAWYRKLKQKSSTVMK